MSTHRYISIEEYIKINGKDNLLKNKMLEFHVFLKNYLSKYNIQTGIGYNMPVYIYKGRPAVYFALAKNHISFNIPPYGLFQNMAEELKDYKTTISALHLPHSKNIDYQLIEKILDYRIKEMEKYESKKFKKS
jgi:uncharacterized protein YdhG (YjbR/CyaY superfamily)